MCELFTLINKLNNKQGLKKPNQKWKISPTLKVVIGCEPQNTVSWFHLGLNPGPSASRYTIEPPPLNITICNKYKNVIIIMWNTRNHIHTQNTLYIQYIEMCMM